MSGSNYEHGVKYTPSSVSSTPAVEVSQLYNRGIRYVRLQWVDLVNNIRYRVLSLSHFEKILASPRPSIAVTKTCFGLVFISTAPGFTASGEYLYVPDLGSLRVCTYAPRHASVMGYFEEKEPVPGPDGALSVKVPLCPRANLRRIVEEAKDASGIEFLVGVESEFILLKTTSPIEPVNWHGWSNAPALSTGTVEAKAVEEIADALQDAGIDLQMYHAEAAPGQYEVITGPLPPLQAADALIFTRETIYNIATKHGLKATFAPRVYLDNCGSAAHTHISVHPTRPFPNLPASPFPPSLTPLEASFLQGLLTHLPSLIAFTLPLPASYKRMVDGVWSGGTYCCWGTENREAPVRLCNAASPRSRNFEVKCVDGTSNPYLVLAALVGAGARGVKEGLALSVKDVTGDRTAATMSEGERREAGVTQRLPLDLGSAREKLGANEVVREILGGQMVDTYLNVNQHCEALMEAGTEEEVLKRLVENY